MPEALYELPQLADVWMILDHLLKEPVVHFRAGVKTELGCFIHGESFCELEVVFIRNEISQDLAKVGLAE